MYRRTLIILAFIMSTSLVTGQVVTVDLIMSDSFYYPGSNFFLDLRVSNQGPAKKDTQLFIALSLGTDDFWFYPSWVQYPSNVDWLDLDLDTGQNRVMEIIPDFPWPFGSAELDNASFYAGIMKNDQLISNLDVCDFGFSGEPPIPPPEMIYVPQGSFLMGSPDSERCRSTGEIIHQVTLTYGFYMMKTEMTRHFWQRMKIARPSLPNDPSMNDVSPTNKHPVQNMTWFEALFFCNELSIYYGLRPCFYRDMDLTEPMADSEFGLFVPLFFDQTANGFRLPTEAEWEYAARAGTTGAFYFEETNYNDHSCIQCSNEYPLTELEKNAWCMCNSDMYTTLQGGQRLSNPWGFFDVYGNVKEWCLDRSFYDQGDVIDPFNFQAYYGYIRAVRGGGLRSAPLNCRSADRESLHPHESGGAIGLRLVRNAQ